MNFEEYKKYADMLNDIISSNNNRGMIVNRTCIRYNALFRAEEIGLILSFSSDYHGINQHTIYCYEDNRKSDSVESYDFLTIPNLVSLCLNRDISMKDKYNILSDMITRSVV